jgi:hypothetical protein
MTESDREQLQKILDASNALASAIKEKLEVQELDVSAQVNHLLDVIEGSREVSQIVRIRRLIYP